MDGRQAQEARQSPPPIRWRPQYKGSAQAPGARVEGRRAEDRYSEERHDALAKTIFATTPVEQRQYRSDRELRAAREELKRQWERRQTKAMPARARSSG